MSYVFFFSKMFSTRKTWSVLLVVYLFSDFSHGQRDKKFFREDYSYLETTEGFYKIHTKTQTWAEAKQVCALEGASLFHPDNRDEAYAVISFWNRTQPEILEVYIGLSDITREGQFETVDGKSVSEVYNQWKQGEPTDSNGNEDCVFLYPNGELNDYRCDIKSNFICKKSFQTLERNDNCNLINSDEQRDKKFFREDYSYLETTEGFYKIHTKTQTWAEAKQVCALEGASLFHPDNRDEANAVISFWNRTQPEILEVYIGLSDITREGQFETVDGKSVSEVYNQWRQGEPSDSNGNEDCVFLYPTGELNDYRCDIKSNFICKKSILTLERNDNCNLNNSDGQKDKKFFREDYSYLETTEGFYKIHSTAQTWAEANQVCALEGASLFYPDNRDEANAVISFWKSTNAEIGHVFIGLSDITSEGKFETVDVSEVYNQWRQGEPNNEFGNEDCVQLFLNGELNDYPCCFKSNFICKKSIQTLERNDNCNLNNSAEQRAKKFFRNDYGYIETSQSFYKMHTIPKTFTDAKRECDLEGASLFYPDNRDEAEAVIEFWNRTQPTIPWVYAGISALIADGVFETIDNKPFSEVYQNWMSGEPNDALDKENCVLLNKDGTYFDYRCDNKYQFICKKTLQSLEWNNCCNMPDLDYTFNKDNGKCYKFHTTPLKWTEAYAVCSAEQSYLAVISNRSVADYLAKLTESAPKQRVKENYLRGIYHVGFHNKFNKGWQTVKGTPLNDTEVWWGNYQPDADDREQCGSMFFNGLLTYTNCDMRSFFICEHEEDSASQSKEENYY